jgi:hypothetical protein
MSQLTFSKQSFLLIKSENEDLKRDYRQSKLELNDLYSEFQSYKTGKVI